MGIFSDPTTPFGFTDFELCKDKSYAKIHMSGLLTGAIGVWLTLLTVEKRVYRIGIIILW